MYVVDRCDSLFCKNACIVLIYLKILYIHMYLKYFYVCFYPFEEKTPKTRADSKYGVNSMILHFNI